MSIQNSGSGIVTIHGDGGASREFHIMPLDLTGESALWRHLETLSESVVKAKRQELLVEIGTTNTPRWLVRELMDSIVSKLADPPSYEAVMRFRSSPEGVAVELWHRAKGQSPGLRLDEIKAIVTEANNTHIFQQITEITSGSKRGTNDTKSEGVAA